MMNLHIGRDIRRRGFTLLELILALSLSLVLLLALYLALSTHYNHARIGREIIDETVVTRFVVTRISQDITCQLSAIDPRLATKGGSGGNSSTGGATTGAATTPSSGSTASNSASNSTSNSGTNSTPPFNLGVLGDENHVVLTGKWVPKDLTQPAQTAQALTCDLRRVTYWVVGDGAQAKGLARQELTRVTGPEADSMPPDVPDPESFVIAPEVKKLQLEYYDGTTWQSSWDGSTLDATTNRPKGPPAAIAVTLTLVLPGRTRNDNPKEVSYRHVVVIPAANSFVQSQTSSP